MADENGEICIHLNCKIGWAIEVTNIMKELVRTPTAARKMQIWKYSTRNVWIFEEKQGIISNDFNWHLMGAEIIKMAFFPSIEAGICTNMLYCKRRISKNSKRSFPYLRIQRSFPSFTRFWLDKVLLSLGLFYYLYVLLRLKLELTFARTRFLQTLSGLLIIHLI